MDECQAVVDLLQNLLYHNKSK